MYISQTLNASFLKDVKIIKLENGMTALFKPDSSLPITSLQVWVGAGSAYEDKNTRGLSHFLEHLIFKGTKKYPGDAISHLVETNGGVINAGTSKEYTVYYIDIQKEAFEQAADILADAMQNALMPDDEIERERPVVLEEIKRHDDSPEGVLYDIFSETIFTASPYKYRIIGDEEVIRKVNRQEIMEYYKKFYVPSNMTVSIVGDLATDEVEKILLETFGKIPHGEKPLDRDMKETLKPSFEITRRRKNVAHTYAICGFLGPNNKDENQFAAEISSIILGDGHSSRLYKNLREKKQLVYSIGSSYYGQKGDGIFSVAAIFDRKNFGSVKKEVESELSKLAGEGPSAEELDRAKELIKSQWVFNQEKVHDQAGMLGYWHLQGNLNIIEEFMGKINSVTKEDVKKFLKNYGSKGVVWALVEPQ